jgi:hypothetical protein
MNSRAVASDDAQPTFRVDFTFGSDVEELASYLCVLAVLLCLVYEVVELEFFQTTYVTCARCDGEFVVGAFNRDFCSSLSSVFTSNELSTEEDDFS